MSLWDPSQADLSLGDVAKNPAVAGSNLLTFPGGNPLVVNNDVADAITIAAPHLAAFRSGPWTTLTVPAYASTEAVVRYVFAWDVNNYIAKWSSSGQYKLRLGGTNYFLNAITHSASANVVHRFHAAGTVWGISVNGGPESTVAIANTSFPDTLLYVGQGYLSNLPFSGSIHEPVAA